MDVDRDSYYRLYQSELVKTIEAIEVIEAVEVIEAAEVKRPGKSQLGTAESSRFLNSALF